MLIVIGNKILLNTMMTKPETRASRVAAQMLIKGLCNMPNLITKGNNNAIRNESTTKSQRHQGVPVEGS